ncbi:MAG: hypothetical protein KAT43_02715 [Nanoarchaeota archaeon]|nr:hypothetical protein [Nanoarchaeota archaeon]
MGEGGGTGTGAVEETRFDRISLEDFAVLDIKRKPEHSRRGRIRIQNGIWHQDTLYVKSDGEARKIKLKSSPDIHCDPNSRDNFLLAANTFLEEHNMYLVLASYTPASLWNLFHHSLEGDLYQRSSRYANLLGWNP